MKVKLTCTKMKDHEAPKPQFFSPEVVDLGYVEGDDFEEMEQATSLVLKPADSAVSRIQPPKLTHPQELVLGALQETSAETAGGRVHVDQWKAASMQKSLSDSSIESSKNKAFNRARKDLLAKGYVATENDFYWEDMWTT